MSNKFGSHAFSFNLIAEVECPEAMKTMTFAEAINIANKKESLVNRLTSNNVTLNEIIIAPTDPDEFAKFIQSYIQTLDAQISIVPFIKSDLMVLGVFDKTRIKDEGILLIKEV